MGIVVTDVLQVRHAVVQDMAERLAAGLVHVHERELVGNDHSGLGLARNGRYSTAFSRTDKTAWPTFLTTIRRAGVEIWGLDQVIPFSPRCSSQRNRYPLALSRPLTR